MNPSDNMQSPPPQQKHRGEVARFTLDVDPQALKHIIADGRLMEFASALADHAAAQISAQLVEQVAGMAIGGTRAGVTASFVLEAGDFGTVPPRPKFGVGPIPRFENILQRFSMQGIEMAGRA